MVVFGPLVVCMLLVLALALGVVKFVVTDNDEAYERPATREERERNPFGLPDHIARCVTNLGEIGLEYEPLRRCVGLWGATSGTLRYDRRDQRKEALRVPCCPQCREV